MKKNGPLRNAFSLVEVTLALGVTGFCMLSVFGLLSTGVASTQDSISQTTAASIANNALLDLKVTPEALSTSPYLGIAVPTTGIATHTIFLAADGSPLGQADKDADPAQDPKYRATLTFHGPATAGTLEATKVRIQVTWPAMADPRATAAPKNANGRFEVNSALVRK